jgi:hypothetical protein
MASAAMIEGRRFRYDTFLERRVFGKDYFILTALLCKGSVVMMLMVMLVLRLQRRISMKMLGRVYRDIVGLGRFFGHGVLEWRLNSPFQYYVVIESR